jgi:ankyrin repeat protein
MYALLLLITAFQTRHAYLHLDTPIHAAASYNHIALLKSLVGTHNGNPNITDHDGDTPLFFVETVETARCLVEELGADPSLKNNSGLTVCTLLLSLAVVDLN